MLSFDQHALLLRIKVASGARSGETKQHLQGYLSKRNLLIKIYMYMKFRFTFVLIIFEFLNSTKKAEEDNLISQDWNLGLLPVLILHYSRLFFHQALIIFLLYHQPSCFFPFLLCKQIYSSSISRQSSFFFSFPFLSPSSLIFLPNLLLIFFFLPLREVVGTSSSSSSSFFSSCLSLNLLRLRPRPLGDDVCRQKVVRKLLARRRHYLRKRSKNGK